MLQKENKMKLKYFIIGCLGLVSFIIGVFGYQDSFITSLSDMRSLPKTQRYMSVLPQSPYQGQFVASYDRLGTVKVRISTEGRINTNTIVFRLRKVGTTTWLVENTYATDRFIDGELYPFGFPVIEDSKGKAYEYELTTVDGTEGNTIVIIPGMYAFQAQYIYSQHLIRSDARTTQWFFIEKTKELFGTFSHIGYWMMCLLPLLFLTDIYAFACIGMILLFGFLPMQIHSSMVLWIGASILGASLYKRNYVLPFVLILCTLVVCVAVYFFGTYYIASKLATIIPILLTIGGIITLVNIKR